MLGLGTAVAVVVVVLLLGANNYRLIQYSVGAASHEPPESISLAMGGGQLAINTGSEEIVSDFELVDGRLVIQDTLFRGPDDDLDSTNGVINYVLIRARNGEGVEVSESGGVMTWVSGGVVLEWERLGFWSGVDPFPSLFHGD